MDDLISRRAAIDALYIPDYENGEAYSQYVNDKRAIELMPSAQPTQNNTSNALKSLDCIDREAAINAADRTDYLGLAVEDVKKVTDEVIKELKKLPSVQPVIRTEMSLADCISRQAAIDALCTPHGILYPIRTIEELPSAQPERMTNRQWVDFLSAQFDISRTSAKEMLHGMMRWKKEDNFKKMFNGGTT